jgi:NADH-quinone oxidoreductase subunit H
LDWLLAHFSTLPLLGGLPYSAQAGLAMGVYGAVVLVIVALAVMVFSLAERKVAGFMQSRYGPMYVGGWHGILQPLADGIKFLLKEDIAPAAADKLLWRAAPIAVFTGAFMGYAVIPWGPSFVGAKLDMGLFYAFATSSLVVMGIIMAGWGSNNKWSLYGAMRGAAQVISYEIPLGLAVLPVIMGAGTLNMGSIVQRQAGFLWNWNVFNPLFAISFVLYFVSAMAEVNRIPFDLPESESELVAGYHTEYTGMKFAFMMLGEYADMFLVATIATAVFLGGWWTGIPRVDHFVPAPVIFTVKAVALVFIMMWLRWTLPRLRVDQLMHLCWKIFIPIALGNLLLYGLIRSVI